MANREVRHWKSLMGKQRLESNDSGLLEKLDPYLIWDREYHNHAGLFFQNPVGRYRQDPDFMADFADTNMTLGGNIGLPLIFEAREIRYYPGSSLKADVNRWRGFDWKAQRFEGQSTRHLKLEAHDHLPLPEVDNFSLEERELRCRIDLAERAKPLLELVNEYKLPCLVAKLDYTIYSLDFLGYMLNTVAEVHPKVRTYAVLVGAMWVSK